MRLAGTPTYRPFGSVDFVTTAPAPTTHPRATLTPGMMIAPLPIQLPSAITIGNDSTNGTTYRRPHRVRHRLELDIRCHDNVITKADSRVTRLGPAVLVDVAV